MGPELDRPRLTRQVLSVSVQNGIRAIQGRQKGFGSCRVVGSRFFVVESLAFILARQSETLHRPQDLISYRCRSQARGHIERLLTSGTRRQHDLMPTKVHTELKGVAPRQAHGIGPQTVWPRRQTDVPPLRMELAMRPRNDAQNLAVQVQGLACWFPIA